jgi:Protein of unknown function (DUF4231)
MKIPVFVSCPTTLSDQQTAVRQLIIQELGAAGLEPRRVAPSDYPTDFPLREVLRAARHCYGGIILGFEQIRLQSGTAKAGTPLVTTISAPTPLPSPWNQLEAGVLFSLDLPIIVFKEAEVSGGVFDAAVNDVLIQPMPTLPLSSDDHKAMVGAIQQWHDRVQARFDRDAVALRAMAEKPGFEGYSGYLRLEKQIDWYDKKSGESKRRFQRLKTATLAISVSIPVVSGLVLLFPNLGGNRASVLTGVCGATIALLEGLQQLNQYHQNWISYRSTAEALKHEKFLYIGKAGPYASAKNPDSLLTETVESLVSQEHAKWSSVQQQAEKKQPPPPG